MIFPNQSRGTSGPFIKLGVMITLKQKTKGGLSYNASG